MTSLCCWSKVLYIGNVNFEFKYEMYDNDDKYIELKTKDEEKN